MKRLLALLLLLALSPPAFGMETVLSMRAVGLTTTSATRYCGLMGAGNAQSTDTYSYTIFPCAGSLSTFAVVVSVAPGGGQQSDWTIYKNGASQTTFSITGTNTTASYAGPIAISAGDYVHIRCVGNSAATATGFITCTFTSTASGESVILGGGGSAGTSATVDGWGGLMGFAASAWQATDVNARQCIPTGGSASHLYVITNLALTSGSYDFTLIVNGTPSALTVNLGTSVTQASDTAHSVALSAGDLVSIECSPNPTTQSRRIQWGLKWTPTIDGEAVVLGGASNDLSATATEYNFINNGAGTWSAVESDFTIAWPGSVELRKLATTVEVAPGGSTNYHFTVRDDGANTALDVAISGSSLYGIDSSHTVTPAAGSLICFSSIPGGGVPATGNCYWGVVAYIAPVASSRRVMVVQ